MEALSTGVWTGFAPRANVQVRALHRC
jgi:hypothetical protein